jgi:hypothetical protein
MCRRTPRDTTENMFLNVLANSRQIELYGDASGFKYGWAADA